MSDTLQHHGVFGMKWGVRRYQNEDGTLTSAGKKRYSQETKLSGKTNAHDDYRQAHDRKNAYEYSTKEMQAIVNRLNLEQQYSKLTSDSKSVVAGRKKVASILRGTSDAIGAATPIAFLIGKEKGFDTKNVAIGMGLAAAIAKLVAVTVDKAD